MKYLASLFILPFFLQAEPSSIEMLQKQLLELEEQIEQIETKVISDKFIWSGELELRNDHFSYALDNIVTDRELNALSESDRDNSIYDKRYKPHFAFKLKLNVKTDIDQNMKFRGRFLISRSSENYERLCILSPDISASSQQVNTTFDLDRAYIDYTYATKSLFPSILSIGILPTTGGLGHNLKENTKRKSVFPSLVFDMASYGAIFNTSYGNKATHANRWLRLIFAKAYTLNSGHYYYQCNRETIQNATIVGAFYEQSIPSWGDNTFYLGVNTLLDLKAVPYLGSSSSSIDLKSAQSMGSMTNVGTGFELRSVAQSSWDLFLHLGWSLPNGNGTTINFTDDNSTGDAITNPFTSASYARGTLLTENGHAVHTGFKYSFENHSNLGFEYNYGSRYWWSGTQGAEDVFNKLATRGHAYELYYHFPVSSMLSLKAGALVIQEAYTGSGWHFGEPAPKEGAMQKNIYFAAKAKF